MKKALLLTGLLLALMAPMATAAGLNIAWGTECWGQLTGPSNLMTFACASNTVPTGWKITPSFVLDTDVPDLNSVNVVIRGVSELGSIPAWWQLSQQLGVECRYTSTNTGFSGTYAGAVGTCVDPFMATQAGGGGYGYIQTNGAIPLVVQINGVYGVADGLFAAGGVETFAYTFTVRNSKTLGVSGTTKCDGCAAGMVFGVNYGRFSTTSGAEIAEIGEVIPGGNQCLIWQRGFNMAAAGDYLAAVQPCSAPVPARNTTWGQVKSLYR
jgi:hypothetical protein